MAGVPTVTELREALEHIPTLTLGLNDVEEISRHPKTSALLRLKAVDDRVTEPATAYERGYAVLDLIELAVDRTQSPAREIARAALGIGEQQGLGKKLRFQVAREEAVQALVPKADFLKTTLPNSLAAVAIEVQKLEVAAQGAAIRRKVNPAVQRRLAEAVEQARSHLPGLQLSLPRLRVTAVVHRQPPGLSAGDDTPVALLQRWASDAPDSNLAVVLGPFGSGKTDALVSFAESLRETAADRLTLFALYGDVSPDKDRGLAPSQSIFNRLLSSYDLDVQRLQQVRDQLVGSIVVLDGFDEVWGSHHGACPDLTHLRALLDANARVAVAARRHFDMAADPFVAQLLDPTLLAQAGVRSPLVLELRAPSFGEIRSVLSDTQLEQATLVLEYLSRFPEDMIAHLFRPLLLQMLLMTTDELPNEQSILSVAKLYRRYTNNVLQRDYHQELSKIPPDVKRLILIAAAGDALSKHHVGASGASSRGTHARCSFDDVSLRVLEALDHRGLADPRTNWTKDFAQTNHLLRPVPAEPWTAHERRAFDFTHPTFFELFIAESMLSRLEHGESMGLRDTDFVESLFDSLVPYFLSAYATSRSLDTLRKLTRRDAVGFCERSLCLRLLEDDPSLPELLAQVPSAYWKQCRDSENRVQSFFLKKVIKYQLILVEQDESRALEYVHLVKESERIEHRDLEATLFATRSSREDYLLCRLNNPNLKSARIVTLFRLGQFGGTRALAVLKNHLNDDDLPEATADVLREAVAQIEGRL